MAAGPTTNPGSNVLYYELVLEANDFMATLKTAEGQALSFDETMAVMQAQVKKLMEEFGIDAPTAIRVLQQVRGELDLDAAALERLQGLARSAALSQVGRDIEEANFAGISFESTLRMIEGVIVSMAVFQGIQMIVQGLQDAIKNATEYYQALNNITAAQSSLAQAGVNVTNQQMLDIVDQLHQKWQTISQVDITAAVAQAGLMASEYHMSVEQMTQLANEAAILHQLDPSKPMADYVTLLAKAIDGSGSLSINGAQISFHADTLLAKAKELNLVASDYKGALTEQQKLVAGLAIEYDRLNPEAERLAQNQNSVLGSSEALSATWKDASTHFGQLFGVVTSTFDKIITAYLKVQEGQDQWNKLVEFLVSLFAHLDAAIITYVALWQAANEALHGHFDMLSQLPQIWDKALASATTYFQNLFQFGGINMQQNTPTAPAGANQVAPLPDESKITSILDSVAKDYQSYYDSVQKATESFDNRMQDLQDRYNLQVQNEVANVNLRMEQERQNFRLKQLQQEEDFQRKMKDLTARYLLDLEDALRKRDAEAVIKIIERYNLEKTTAQQQETLKQQQDAQSEKLKLEQMKAEENLRLSQMKAEFNLQQTEATRAYNQQLADLRNSLDTKLQEEAVKAQQELGLNTTSIEAIYKLFTTYYGPNGKFAQEQQGAYTKMLEQSQGFVDQMAVIMAQFSAVLNSIGATTTGGTGLFGEGQTAGGYGSPAPAKGFSHPRFAGGGMALAASATDVTFGEAGPELAMFLPLNSAGSPSVSGVGGGGFGGFGGQAMIALALSPDLEARIVSTTLTHAAISIEKVYGRA